MINQALLKPQSIVVVGASNDVTKPGGKVLRNILEGGYPGRLLAINPKRDEVQGVTCLPSVDELAEVELAIISIPARFCPATVKTLAHEKGTTAFIILSAGFAEQSEQGRRWEQEIAATVNSVGGCLLGPNCIGLLNTNYHGVFTAPIPELDPQGCDLVSSSGATAVFLLEAGMRMGLKFAGVYSVGNGAQVSIEDVLEHMDRTFDPAADSRVKLLYLESVTDPAKLLKHASSLIRKGARIAAIKAGRTAAGSRAAASHTGALASPDLAVAALFDKAGIVRCNGRQELLSVAALLTYPELTGPNIAVITHAGGPAVMLTDALDDGGLKIPAIEGPDADELLGTLNPGSTVANPIDFLATGSAEQLGGIIDYCENRFDHIDAMVVVFGSPGLFDVAGVYALLREKMQACSKPIYPVLPSVVNAAAGIAEFHAAGFASFADEVVLAQAMCTVAAAPAPADAVATESEVDTQRIRAIVDAAGTGFLPPGQVHALLHAAGIPHVSEWLVTAMDEIEDPARAWPFPLAMKAVGPLHKTDIGGVVLDVRSVDEMRAQFIALVAIDGATGVLVQPMLHGTEWFIGLKREPGFGHLVLCGPGGVLVEMLGDVSACLAPVSQAEATRMVRDLKAYPVIRGIRGRPGLDETLLNTVIQRASALAAAAPEIAEMDINPLVGSGSALEAVDARIRIEK
ncbi:MAG: acetate--CoA ligase family protein [Lysobacterales bacterium]|jgi:acetyltransferase